MNIIKVAEGYSVSEQIAPFDLLAVKDQGFTTVICNRPDSEVESGLFAAEVQAQAESAGLTFIYNPMGKQLEQANLDVQAQALENSEGPVLAYCRTGHRCTILWSLVNAKALPAQDIVNTAARAGFNIENLKPLIESIAQS